MPAGRKGRISLAMPDPYKTHTPKTDAKAPEPAPAPEKPVPKPAEIAGLEIGGPKGLEPTRYGDWERGGRCVDF